MPLDEFQKDDTFEDVMAAFKELSGKSDDEPAGDPPASHAAADPVEADAEAARSPAPDKDELGNFKKSGAERADKGEQGGKAEAGQEGADKTEAAQEPSEDDLKAGGEVSPPPSWTVKSKSAWDKLPAEVKADIAKREREVANGLAELRDYKDLKPYAELAKKHNTTISAALKHYTGMENLLRKDVGAGLATILQNYGYNQQQAAQLFGALAQKFGAKPQAGNGHAAPQPGANGQTPQPGDPLYNILKPFLDPLQNEVSTLKQSLTSREQADRNASEQSLTRAIEAFSQKPENRFFSDLEDTISRLFETGYVKLTGNHESDLRTAYDLAAQMVPEVREALIEQRVREQTEAARKKEQETAQKAKGASRSITGSRVPGTVMNDPKPAQPGLRDDDIEADVRAAYRLHSQY